MLMRETDEYSATSRCLCLSSLLSLVLCDATAHTEHLLSTVLLLLDLLSRSLTTLGQTRASKAVTRLEFLSILDGVIYQSKSS